MKVSLEFHADGGHGWLKVPKALRTILEPKRSQFDYKGKAGELYLEEDCNAPRYIKDLEKLGVYVGHSFIEHDGQCFIRNLPRNF